MPVFFRGDPAGVFRAVFDKSVAAESSASVQKWTPLWKERVKVKDLDLVMLVVKKLYLKWFVLSVYLRNIYTL